MHEAGRHTNDLVPLKALHVSWCVSVFEVAQPELAMHVETPGKQKAFWSGGHAVLPTTRYVFHHDLEELTLDQRRL